MLNIFLGYACNFSCDYCLQPPKSDRDMTRRTDPSFFIENVVPYVKEKGIREIAYWGGEPLLYWDSIVAIHEALLAEGLSFDHINFATNGARLTDEIVEKLNEWGFYVVVSQHPGFGEPNWDLVAKLHNSSVSFLFNHQQLEAWPFIENVKKLEEKYNRPFFPFAHWTRATKGCAPEFRFTFEDIDKHIAHLYELADAAIAGDKHCQGLFRGWVPDWARKLKPDYDGRVDARCYSDAHISVDLHGNRYACHHSVSDDQRTGTLWEVDSQETVDRAERFTKTSECMSCPIRTYCRGNCHLSETHEVDCMLTKRLHQVYAYYDEAMNGELPRNQVKVRTSAVFFSG